MQSRYGDRLAALNAGIAREGGFYLFTLRLVPAVPFFVINLAMGLTPIRPLTFYRVSQLGMLAEYVLAMTHGIGLNKILGTIHTCPTLARGFDHRALAWREDAPKAVA